MLRDCRHCGRPLPPPTGPGRPAVWCSRDCRKAARYQARMREYEARLAAWMETRAA